MVHRAKEVDLNWPTNSTAFQSMVGSLACRYAGQTPATATLAEEVRLTLMRISVPNVFRAT